MDDPQSSIAPTSGILLRSACSTVVVAVSGEPSIATAPCPTYFLKRSAEVVALAPSLPDRSLSFLPSTPPFALISSTAILVPLITAWPVDPYAPVVPAIAPTTIGSEPPLPDEPDDPPAQAVT